VTPGVLVAASELAKIYPAFPKLIATMENCRKPEELISLGLALSNIKTFLGGSVAISSVSSEDLERHGITDLESGTRWAVNLLKSVIGWEVCACCIETKLGSVKISFAVALGGGGHKAAAGATLTMPLEQAIEKIVQTAKEIYNL
jgi:phosphoesterase RecJ-like protein